MFKTALRTLLSILVFTLLIPIKLLVVLYLMVQIPYCAHKGSFTVKEGLSYVWDGMRLGFMAELDWIKTGNLES